jgi:hypothetical protein
MIESLPCPMDFKRCAQQEMRGKEIKEDQIEKATERGGMGEESGKVR